MRVSEVSKRYAKALLAVTKQKGSHLSALEELSQISEAFQKDETISSYFANPMIASEKKVAAVKAALAGRNISEEVINAITLLGEKNRLPLISEVGNAFQDLLDIEEGVTRGVVKSAQPLSDEAKKEIENKMNKVLNKKIVLTYQQDPKLLGGVITQVGGWTFDDSLDTHLKKLNEELNRRAN